MLELVQVGGPDPGDDLWVVIRDEKKGPPNVVPVVAEDDETVASLRIIAVYEVMRRKMG